MTRRPAALLAALALVLTTGASQAPPATARARTGAASVSEVAYGPDPLQVVTVSRPAAPTGKAVLFLHGGGWNAGGRGSLEAEAAEWAKTGWIAVNASYRLGVLDGQPDDGKAILADALAALQLTRSLPGVDPARVVVYGESAGGHLATWLGAKYGPLVAATVAISPVASISGAIGDRRTSKAASLADRAAEFFGYSVGTTDAHRYLDRVQAAYVVISTKEWVDPELHGRPFCAALGDRCTLVEYAGTAHAGTIVDQHPEAAVDARHWADRQLVAA